MTLAQFSKLQLNSKKEVGDLGFEEKIKVQEK